MSMIIKGVTPEDAGTYTVVASNELGKEEADIELHVKSKYPGHCFSCPLEMEIL